MNKLLIRKKIDQIDHELTVALHSSMQKPDYGFMTGYPGISLFYQQMDLALGTDHTNELGWLLMQSFELLGKTTFQPGYCSGVSGLLDVVDFYKKTGLLDDDFLSSDDTAMLNNKLFSSFESCLKHNNLDYLHGAEGILRYFLSTSSVQKEKSISMYLDHLEKTVIQTELGMVWRSQVMHKNELKQVFNMGLAHGMAAKLVVLSAICRNTQSNESRLRSEKLLRLLAMFFLADKKRFFKLKKIHSAYSNYSSLDGFYSTSRLAWCYGDPGIGIALWQAGQLLKSESVCEVALEVMINASKRTDKEEALILDAGLCHGSSGVAHIFNCMYRFTGQQTFQSAANFWLDETLQMSTEKKGIAGFTKYTTEGEKTSLCLLNGVSGIGLILLSFLNPEPTEWDRYFLLSID